MVFMERSDASTLQQHAQEVMRSIGQLLLLVRELLGKDATPALDHECAEATESLLRSRGTVVPLENGRTATHLAVGNYELQADLNDRSGRPTFTVYDLESGEKVMSARRTAKGDYELHTVNQPLNLEQQQAFLAQLQQTLQGEVVPGLSGLERVQAMVNTMDEQAPRGCKAVLVAKALLGDELEVSDQQYTYRREANGNLSITDTKAQALVAVMSPAGDIDQALSQRDQAYFKQAYERMQLESRQSQPVTDVELSLDDGESQRLLAALTVDDEGREARKLLAAQAAVVHLRDRGERAVTVPVEVVDGEFVDPPGQRRIQARVVARGLESAGGDLALYVGAQLVAQHGGKEYVGERYQVTAYGNGAMTVHATGQAAPLVYANSAGEVTSQLTPDQTQQFRQMYQSLTQPQLATPALSTGRTTPARALNPTRSFDLGGR